MIKHIQQMWLLLFPKCKHPVMILQAVPLNKDRFYTSKEQVLIDLHHVNPARSPSDTTARKAACQRLKQCYSNITLECLHTSGITHTHIHPSWKFAAPLSCPAGGQGQGASTRGCTGPSLPWPPHSRQVSSA